VRSTLRLRTLPKQRRSPRPTITCGSTLLHHHRPIRAQRTGARVRHLARTAEDIEPIAPRSRTCSEDSQRPAILLNDKGLVCLRTFVDVPLRACRSNTIRHRHTGEIGV